MPGNLLSIDALLIAAAAWLAIGLCGLVAPRNAAFISRVLFPLGAAVGIGMGVAALNALGGEAQTAVLVIGLLFLYNAVRAFMRASIIGGVIWLLLGLWVLSWVIS